ncbi:hypothetical protein [Pseudomonas sp. RT6P73]
MAQINKATFAFQKDHGAVPASDRSLISCRSAMCFTAADDIFEADHGPDWVFCVPVVHLFLQLCSSWALWSWHICFLLVVIPLHPVAKVQQ